MTDGTKNIWRVCFFFAGLYNIGWGIFFLWDLGRGMELFTTYRTAEPHTLFIFFLFWFAITAIGLSFWQVTYNLQSNRAWLTLVAIGKMALFVIFLYGYANDLVSWLAVLVGVGEFLWGILFVWFLYQSRNLFLERF